jgi:DNA-binding GntR family transcriptional regulator
MIVETQLNPTQPVNQQIYRILRRDIVHCLIPPGTPLSEKEVSIRFDVSRQPVREAFIKLAENGLIQIRPQRGSYVNKISWLRSATAASSARPLSVRSLAAPPG